MNVVVPIATVEPAFEDAGYRRPRPLVKVSGRPLIKWVTDCVADIADTSAYIFPVLKRHINEYEIDSSLTSIFSEEVKIVPISGETDGAARTVLKAKDYISEEDLLVLLGDQYIEMELEKHISKQQDIDGLIPVFQSTEPAWSYAAVKKKRTVSKVAEKEVISSHATAGAYYFSDGLDFVDAAKQMIEKDIRTNGLFYICPVYNELIKMSKRIEIMPVNRMEKLSTPADLEKFESGNKSK